MYQYEYDAALDRQAGFEEGREEGIEQGKLETIGQMLKVGTPIHFIEVATGWTREQILAVIKDKQKATL